MARGRTQSHVDGDGIKEKIVADTTQDKLISIEVLCALKELLVEQKKTNQYLAEITGETL